MSQLLEQLIRAITTTEVWWGSFFLLLLGVGLNLLGRGLGFAFKFEGWTLTIESISNEALKPRSRVVLSLIGIGLFVAGLMGLYRLTSMTTLEVLVSFSEEEYAQFRLLEEQFNKKHEGERLRIRSDNVDQPELVRRLKQKRIDVIIFDMIQRLELLREGLLKPLDDHRRLIPSSVNPTLLDKMSFNQHLYFLPYRPNVRIGWWNSHHPTARACASPFKELDTTQTWQDVQKFAACSQPATDSDNLSEARLDQYGVVLSANGMKKAAEDGDKIDPHSPPLDAALLLLEVLMASGKKPWEVCESWQDEKKEKKEDTPLKVLRDIYKAASPRSSATDWQTATGHLLSRHVALARNWSFSIATMRDSGELQHFHPHVAWAWRWDGEKKEKNNRFRTLLGGDVIALPRHGRQGDDVDKLLRFLISQDAQKILVEGLPNAKKEGVTWPPMRFDVGGITGSEDEKPQDQKEAQKEAQGKGFPIVDTSLRSMKDIDKQCHANSPPTGENATECARLHLYMARDVVREAMLYAETTPRFWSPEMRESFTAAFHALVRTKNEEDVTAELKNAAGLYCLAPAGQTPKDKPEEQGKKKLQLHDFIALRFEGSPNVKWNDVLDRPSIRVKLVKAQEPRKAASHHTDLCVQLYSDNGHPFLPPTKIPAGFTWELSKPIPAPLFPAVTIKKGKAWELEDPDAKCGSQGETVLEYENPSPLTVVVLPFTWFTVLVLGALIGTFFESKRQQYLRDRLLEAVKAPFTNLKRGLQVVLFILVVPPLWVTLVRLEYVKDVCQFFSHQLPGQAWLIPLALLLGFVLAMVASSGVGLPARIRHCQVGGQQDNGGNDQPGKGNHAHHPQSGPHGKLPGRQPEAVDFGAHKMREVRLQFPDEPLQATERG